MKKAVLNLGISYKVTCPHCHCIEEEDLGWSDSNHIWHCINCNEPFIINPIIQDDVDKLQIQVGRFIERMGLSTILP